MGLECPASHRFTLAKETPSNRAICSCERPKRARIAAIDLESSIISGTIQRNGRFCKYYDNCYSKKEIAVEGSVRHLGKEPALIELRIVPKPVSYYQCLRQIVILQILQQNLRDYRLSDFPSLLGNLL